MTTRTGKIARLPFALREQLNRRLRDNEPSDPLLAWLNALPEVQTLLKDQFQGSPISRQNLSDWRQGGFAEWEFRQEFAAEVLLDTQDIKGESAQIDQGGQEYLADALATVLCGRYASLIARWNGEITAQLDQQLRFLHRLRVDITALRHSHHSNVRAEIARDQHNAKRQPRPQPTQGSAPAPGAVGRAPATHNYAHEQRTVWGASHRLCSVRGRAEQQPGRLCSQNFICIVPAWSKLVKVRAKPVLTGGVKGDGG